MLHSSSFEFDSSSDKIAVIAAFEDGGLCGVMVVDALVPVVIEVNISEEAVVGDSTCGLVVPRAVLDPTPESAPEYDFILFFSCLNGYSNSGSFPCWSQHHYRSQLHCWNWLL